LVAPARSVWRAMFSPSQQEDAPGGAVLILAPLAVPVVAHDVDRARGQLGLGHQVGVAGAASTIVVSQVVDHRRSVGLCAPRLRFGSKLPKRRNISRFARSVTRMGDCPRFPPGFPVSIIMRQRVHHLGRLGHPIHPASAASYRSNENGVHAPSHLVGDCCVPFPRVPTRLFSVTRYRSQRSGPGLITARRKRSTSSVSHPTSS